jgi:branched-chain amino acid aminotransferase
MIVNINGKIVPASEARISIFDHGFLYGASVYETLRTYNRKLFLLATHLERLQQSAQAVRVQLPISTPQMAAEIQKTLDTAPYPEAAIRVIVTRGEGPPGYDPALCATPSYIILVSPLQPPPKEIYEKGVAIALVSVRRNLAEAIDPAIKSGNLLNQMLAWNEAHDRDAYEALMLNHAGELTECSQSNIFLVKNQVLKTPATSCGILDGVTRQLVLEIAKTSNIQALETALSPSDIYRADEAFLTMTSREIIPVVRCDNTVIGSGYPGPVTKALQLKYRQRVRAEIES